MRISLLLMAFALVALPATAQTDYKTVADSTSLTDNGTLADTDVQCMDRNPAGAFVFYDDATGDIVTHDPALPSGSRTVILRSNAEIDADLGGNATNCFAITVDGVGNVYTALQISGGVDVVYKINTFGTTGTALTAADSTGADGMTGLALDGGTLYLARVAFFGAPEDGFYSINTTDAGQSPATVLTDAGLDLVDLELGSDGCLYSSSSEFGSSGGGLRNVVVKACDLGGAPTLSVVYDPFGDGIFTNGSDGGLEDLELVPGSPDRLYLYNNSFGADGGEQWGTVLADGTGGQQFASDSLMVEDPDTNLGGYSSTSGRQMVISGDELYVASRDAFGGDDNIVQITNFPPVPNFGVKVSGVPPTVAQGGSFTVNYVIYNNSASPAPGQIYFKAKRNGNTLAQGTIQAGTLPAGQTFSGSYMQNVPGIAPVGSYSYEVSIGPNQNVAVETEAFPVVVVAASGADANAVAWSVTDATPWPEETAEAAARTSEIGAYPNPFTERTEIAFSLKSASDVSLVIYDVRGREVATLTDGMMEAGQHSVTFDGASLPSGVYVYRLVSGTQAETGRVTLVR